MKPYFIIAYALFLFGVTTLIQPNHAIASTISNKDGNEVILIQQLPNDPIGGPRTLSNVRIEALLDTELYVIDVRLQNAGTSVTVDIENTTTGTSYEYFVSGDGSDSLPISSTPGFWAITFTLSDGSVYAGNFII